jgi:hypothetical protein
LCFAVAALKILAMFAAYRVIFAAQQAPYDNVKLVQIPGK